MAASTKHTNPQSRIVLRPEHVDLGDLLSVRALSRRLLSSIPKLDVLVLNAGIAGFTGLNWFRAIYMILTNIIQATTWPASYCLSKTGVLAKKQTNSLKEPPLGEIFCANVFGHYLLSHELMPLLSKIDSASRVIWTSSLEAVRESFDISDIQGLRTSRSYESCKYLTDLLALTSNLPSTQPWVKNFLDSSTDGNSQTKPNIYVSHPGICGTSILPLALPLFYLMLSSFWLARMFGSPWHVMSSYRGACASVWLSLSPQSVLDEAEDKYKRLGGGKVKWGSSCDRSGRLNVACTEVEGWGYGGLVGGPVFEEDKSRRRKPGAKDLTTEGKVEFEELGRKSWQEMEQLRVQWVALLSEEEKRRAIAN